MLPIKCLDASRPPLISVDFFPRVTDSYTMGTVKRTKAKTAAKSKPGKKSAATLPKPAAVPNTPDFTERPLQPVEEEDIQLSIKRGYKQLKLDPNKASAVATQNAIARALVQVFRAKKKPSPKTIENLAINLGCLWGQTICDVLGWEWCYVTLDESGAYAIVNSKRSHMVAPMEFILEQLQKQLPEENASLFLFNMLKAGSLLKASPRSYVLVG
ncbi:hypothetical protein [Pedosphaera parvula]|nr:hypothetical protein [Pedosphaera parvula]